VLGEDPGGCGGVWGLIGVLVRSSLSKALMKLLMVGVVSS
jgi:hypothetical protein